MKVLSNDLASPELLDDGEAGVRARAAASLAVQTSKRAEFFADGLVLGYGYGDAAAAQAPTPDIYLPVAAPGNRLPHSRNAAGTSVYDLLGSEFTVLGGDPESWTDAAARRGVPLVHLDPAAHGFAPVAGDDVVLVRPDQHIAWIGPSSAEPEDALESAVRGFGPHPH